jgi:hypothetical protein
MIEVGVPDIAKLRRFYEDGLGWSNWIPADANQGMGRLGSCVLSLLPVGYLASECGVPVAPGPAVVLGRFHGE